MEAVARVEAKEKEAVAMDSLLEMKEAEAAKLDGQIAVREKAKATIAEVEAMGKPTLLGGGFIVTADEMKKLKSLAKKSVGIDKRANEYRKKIIALDDSIHDLNCEINSLKQDVKVIARDRDTWKTNYERLWNEVKGFIHAIRRSPRRLLELINEYLPCLRKTKNRAESL